MSEETFQVPSDDLIECSCPYCGRKLSVLPTESGEPIDCPFCGKILLTPSNEGESAKQLVIPVETARLILRSLRREDNTDLLEIMQDNETMRYVSIPALDLPDIDEWLARDLDRIFYMDEGPLDLGVELKSAPRVIGWVRLHYDDDRPVPGGRIRLTKVTAVHPGMKFNLLINRNYWRQGFGLEATRSIQEFVFNHLGSRRLSASFDNRNPAARGLLTKAGFREEGLAYQRSLIHDEWADIAYFAMLKAEYGDSQAA